MRTMHNQIPARAEIADEIRASRYSQHPILRAAFAGFAQESGYFKLRGDAETVAKRLWPDDRDVQILLRADASVVGTGAVPALLQTTVADFLRGIPASAGARLMEAGLRVSLSGGSPASMPFRSNVPLVAPWVGEGDPIPIRQGQLGAVTVGPAKKAAVIMPFSRELAKRGNAEEIFRHLLLEDAGLTIDAAIFNDASASDDNPAGILNGVTPIAGFPGGDLLALQADLKALAAGVAAANGTGALALVVSPTRLATLQVMFPNLAWPVWASRAVADDVVIGLDPTAFAFGASDMVDMDFERVGVLHMSDEPGQIVDGTTADPVREMWQTDVVALRMMLWMDFAMRGDGMVQVIEGATW